MNFWSHRCNLILVFVYNLLPWLHVLSMCRWLNYSELLTRISNCQHCISIPLSPRHAKLSKSRYFEPLIFCLKSLPSPGFSVSRNRTTIHTGTHTRNLRFVLDAAQLPILMITSGYTFSLLTVSKAPPFSIPTATALIQATTLCPPNYCKFLLPCDPNATFTLPIFHKSPKQSFFNGNLTFITLKSFSGFPVKSRICNGTYLLFLFSCTQQMFTEDDCVPSTTQALDIIVNKTDKKPLPSLNLQPSGREWK